MSLITPSVAHAASADLSNVSPHPSNSDPNGEYTHRMRHNENGDHNDVQLMAYYNDGVAVGADRYLEIILGGSNCDYSLTNPGTDSDKVIMRVTVGSKVFNIQARNLCGQKSGENQPGQDNQNVLYASYKLPDLQGVNGNSGMYQVPIKIEYVNTGLLDRNVTTASKNGLGFIARLTGAGSAEAKLGPLGNGARNYSIQSKNSGGKSTLKIPFGLPCNATTDRVANIVVYDADTQVAAFDPKPLLSVTEQDVNSTINLSGVENVRSVGNNTFELTSQNREASRVSMNMRVDTQYVLVIDRLHNGNTIDVGLPEDAIFGTVNCGWRMKGETTVSASTAIRNQVVTFTHTFRNMGRFVTEDVIGAARWGTSGAITSGSNVTAGGDVLSVSNNPLNAQPYDPDESEIRQVTVQFRIPAGATNGSQYCQYPTVDKWKKSNQTRYNFDQACVTVQVAPEPKPNNVILTPFVSATPDEVEPTEPANFTGGVSVSNFPSTSQWGYREMSVQRQPNQVAAVPYGGLERITVLDAPIATTTQTTTWLCGHANDTKLANRPQNTCRHARPGYANEGPCTKAGYSWSNSLGCYEIHDATGSNTTSTTTYSCPYQGSSPLCYHYEYRCQGDVNYTRTQPYCEITYTCPGGTLPVYNTSPPTCNEWRCPYSSAIIYSSTAPTCEFRCTGFGGPGTGERAWGTDGSYTAPCYQRPMFTVVCTWQDGSTTSTPVYNGGITACASSRTKQAGNVVGVDVCNRLTPLNPGSWLAAQAQMGLGFAEPGVTPTQTTGTWGWNISPSFGQACTKVVARPTAKVEGGDVAAGGRFASGNACNGNATSAAITAWPNANNNAFNGAGTQLGAFASGAITGFSTATLRSNTNTQPPNALSFANIPSNGGFGPMPCIADHNSLRPSVVTQINNLNSINPNSDGAYQVVTGGSLNNTTIARGSQVSAYVTSNVYINGNVTYQRNGWASVQDIPAFKLVVYGANIYIDNDVTELNGIYVAQPDVNGNGGNIYTCSNNGTQVSNGNLYNDCRRLLTVNGVFVAKKVHLLRTLGTQIFSGQSNQVAERFNYLPEVWLANWPRNNTTSEVKYDAITNLPPVL